MIAPWLLLVFVNTQFSVSVKFETQAACDAGKSKIESLSRYGVNQPIFSAVCLEDAELAK